MKKILFLFLFIIAINSCKDDEDNIVSSDKRDYTPKIITENYGTAKLVGFVNDKSGNPLSDVTVFFGAEKTLTKSDGSYQLNSLSAGSNKRIWFQKSGYASTQKLADIKEDLPNRIDASLFPIDITTTMSSDVRKIEDEDFSVEIQPGGFVYSDGSPVEEDVTIDVTAFLTSEDEFLNAFPGEFRGTRVDGSETAIESFGFIDVVLKVESGEPVQLAEGVTAIIKIKAPENAPATIPMWYYDEDRAKWLEEGTGSLDNGFYTAEVSHFTKWNWDRPYDETSKIIGRVIDSEGNLIEGASVLQNGITYKFKNSTITNRNGEFELLTPESNESEIEVKFEFYSSTIVNYTTSSIKGQANDIGDITIDANIDDVIVPFVSRSVLYITMGQTAKIRGNYFGEQKRAGYKLLLNGQEVKTTSWQNELIEFDVPIGILEEGTVQIDRNGILSRIVNYEEGDWTCEIGGEIYDNNDLPIESGKYALAFHEQGLLEIPNCIENLHNLQLLSFYNNQVRSLPENLCNLDNLELIILSVNQLTSLPENFGNLKNLHTAELGANQLTSLPEGFGKLKKLNLLRLDENQLTSLPESFGNLQKLEVLYLYKNQLTTLPESFGNLQNLLQVNLDNNQLTSLPESFGNLDKLLELHLIDNQLITLPESIGNLKDLLELTLNGNKIITLPESISNLQNLYTLELVGNQLTTLPESISNIPNLNSLVLGENQLTTLPESISNLQNLQKLYLYNNQITTLPESIGNLSKLYWLGLEGNQLSSLPESIKNLKETLKHLRMYGNNFSEEEKAKVEEWLPNTKIGWD